MIGNPQESGILLDGTSGRWNNSILTEDGGRMLRLDVIHVLHSLQANARGRGI